MNASDTDGMQVVQITYTPPGASPLGPFPMNNFSGTAWRYFITIPQGGWNEGFLAYHVTGIDAFGATTTKFNVDNFSDPSALYVTSFC